MNYLGGDDLNNDLNHQNRSLNFSITLYANKSHYEQVPTFSSNFHYLVLFAKCRGHPVAAP